jgi:hypothetical protein
LKYHGGSSLPRVRQCPSYCEQQIWLAISEARVIGAAEAK